MKINLPVIPQGHDDFTDDEVEEYYVNLFRQIFEKGVTVLLHHYQSQPLEIATFLSCLLEDECIPSQSIKLQENVSCYLLDLKSKTNQFQ